MAGDKGDTGKCHYKVLLADAAFYAFERIGGKRLAGWARMDPAAWTAQAAWTILGASRRLHGPYCVQGAGCMDRAERVTYPGSAYSWWNIHVMARRSISAFCSAPLVSNQALRLSEQPAVHSSATVIRRWAGRLGFLMVVFLSLVVRAEVYISVGPDGERMISDQPVSGYQLVSRRDTVRGAGHILAGRPIETGGPLEFGPLVASASRRYGVDPALVHAVIQVESSFNPNAVSRRGATGLMQLISATAARYQVYDRFDPRANVKAGVQHLQYLLDEFDHDVTLALAAYNAGENAVRRFDGIPPYPETRRYVRKVLDERQRYLTQGETGL